jgi:hypothetical protein
VAIPPPNNTDLGELLDAAVIDASLDDSDIAVIHIRQ